MEKNWIFADWGYQVKTRHSLLVIVDVSGTERESYWVIMTSFDISDFLYINILTVHTVSFAPNWGCFREP